MWLGTTPFGVKLMGDLALSDWKFTLNTRFRVNFQSERAKSPINFTPKGVVPNHTPKRAEISSFTLTEYTPTINVSPLQACQNKKDSSLFCLGQIIWLFCSWVMFIVMSLVEWFNSSLGRGPNLSLCQIDCGCIWRRWQHAIIPFVRTLIFKSYHESQNESE